jgi:bacillithiol system protein YtxJ
MNWQALSNIDQIEAIKKESVNQAVLIFKHSTRCSISAAAMSRLERSWDTQQVKPYYLDLINHRDISSQLASTFGVEHESPQVLLIKNGKSVYDASHLDIRFDEIMSHA